MIRATYCRSSVTIQCLILASFLLIIFFLVTLLPSCQLVSSFSFTYQNKPLFVTATRTTKRESHLFSKYTSSSAQSKFQKQKKHNIQMMCGQATNSSEGTDKSKGNTAPTTMTSQSHPLSPFLSAIGSSTSAVVAFTFFVVLAYRRDALMVSFFIGAITNGILSKVLKKILNQDRPSELSSDIERKSKPSDKGMPSSHAASLGFIGTFTGMSLLVWSSRSFAWTTVVIPIVLYILLSLYYRIQTNLHTIEQVAVGLFMGTTNGFLWKNLCDGTASRWLPFLSNLNIMDWVTGNLLNENGVLPFFMLAIPAILGVIVVGSLERRISDLFPEDEDSQRAQLASEKSD